MIGRSRSKKEAGRIGLVIRPARPDDAEQLTTLMQETVREGAVLRDRPEVPSYTPEQTRSMAERARERIIRATSSDSDLILVAEVDGQIAGEVSFTTESPGIRPGTVAVGAGVKRELRNQGIGSALLAQAVEWARGADSVRRVLLSLRTENIAAIHLYQKHGFEFQRKPYRHPDFPDVELVTMVLHV